jgi:outer membrane biosynthesis protein TonB
MAESTAPPPKSGGSGPIIIAAVLMLLVIGGLIVWKVTSGGEPAKVDAPPVATTAAPVAADEPPPPPPPEPEPEPSAKPDEKKVVKAAGPNPCSQACTGTAPANLESALRGRGAQARGCYEKALSTNPTLEGTMMVSVKVGPGGQVCSASIGNDTLGDPQVKNCVSNHFRSSQLPAPQGGCVDVNVPLRFKAKK